MRVEQLGAHLEVYVATLPTITTLRLCNRFGTGNNCHVNRLPVELVKLVEEQIVETEREKALSMWSRQHRCYENQCTIFDHYSETQEEVYQMYHALYGCVDDKDCGVDEHSFCGHGKCEGDQCPAWKFDGQSDYAVVERIRRDDGRPEYTEVCYDQVEEWKLKIGKSAVHSDGIFKEQHELLKAHFGVIVWLSHFDTFEDGDDRHYFNQFLTTAHLALPDSSTRHEVWCTRNRTAHDMPLNVGPLPTAQSLSRFSRALKILGLQAWQHPIGKAKGVLSPPTGGAAVSGTDMEGEIQPQLTLLVSSKAECGHGRR